MVCRLLYLLVRSGRSEGTSPFLALLPRPHAQGVKQSVCPPVIVVVIIIVVVVIVGTKIARSRILGICKHNELVGIGEKLVSVCFKLLDMAH